MIQHSYDKESDVMYISFGIPMPCGRIEPAECNGIVIGYTSEGDLNGITILDYSKRTTDKGEKDMFEITIKVDENDGDYVTAINKISEKNLETIKPLIKAIKNLEPYTSEGYGDSCTANWPCGEQYNGVAPKDMYPDIDISVIELFEEYLPNCDLGFHTIKSIEICPLIKKEKLL